MRKNKKFMAITLAMLCLCGTMPAYASESGSGIAHVTYVDPSGAEFTGDPFYNPIDGKQARGIFDSYNLESDKSSTQNKCSCEIKSGYDFVCNAWVKITDKKSGTDLKHSTTAALSNPTSGNMYKGAVRNVGSGKVSATSDSVHGWSVARVFWDWVK